MKKEPEENELTAGQDLSSADLLDAIERADDELRAMRANRAELAKQLKTVKQIEKNRELSKDDNLLTEIADGKSMASLAKEYGVSLDVLHRKIGGSLWRKRREPGKRHLKKPHGERLAVWLKENRESLCI
jgi:hypothetical protein